MKTIKEWRTGITQHENTDELIDRIGGLVDQAKIELESFVGDRPEGFLDLCGAVTELKRRVTEIQMGVVGDTPKFNTRLENYSRKK